MAIIIICVMTIALLIFMTLKFPTIRIGKRQLASYWIVALLGALLLIVLNLLPLSEVIEKVKTSKVNPFEIVILFISVTFISIVLDEIGFFSYLAHYVASIARAKQVKLFTLLYLLIGFLTVFTSNDIVILTFTPFICAFCRKTKINALPYLISEFVAANTFSTLLIISNPTNIFIGLNFDLEFISFFKIMFLPTLFMVLTAYIILRLMFRKSLKEPLVLDEEDAKVPLNKRLVAISLAHLIICTILLMISSFINMKMWLICLVMGISLLLFLVFINRDVLMKSLKRSPYDLIPFLLGMFVLILGLEKVGAMKDLGIFIQNMTVNMEKGFIKTLIEVFTYGFGSIIADNLVNNIPMSMAAMKVLEGAQLPSIYATIIGSNIGAYLTPIGALAGIMWLSILKKEQVPLSFLQFTKYGLIIVPLVGVVGFLVLSLVC